MLGAFSRRHRWWMRKKNKKQGGGGTGAAESYSQMAYETEASNYHTALPAHRINAHLPLPQLLPARMNTDRDFY